MSDAAKPAPAGPELTGDVILKAFLKFLQLLAGLAAAIAVVMNAGWWMIEPRVNAYLDAREAGTRERAEARQEQIEAQLAQISNALRGLEANFGSIKPPFLEFFSVAVVATPGPIRAGDEVSFVYLLRRNSPCRSTVEQRFLRPGGQVATQYTREVPGTRAQVTFRPALFPVTIVLPEDMAPGFYSYAPIIAPDRAECPSDEPVTVPPSEYFEVVE